MKISIIGLGLIGGSYALSLKQRFKNLTLYGWDQNEANNLERYDKQKENDELMEELQIALEESNQLREEGEKGKDKALEDLEVMQKKTQFELISTIVKVALYVIVGVGVLTTVMYGLALMSGTDTQIIGSTWSNMFGILLTNAFSIVGTIMGVKYATEKE